VATTVDRPTYKIKRGDTSPPYTAKLVDANDKPLPIGAAEAIRFLMTPAAPGVLAGSEVAAPARVVDVGEAIVAYDWEEGDTDTAGLHYAEWEIIYPGGGKQTVPTEGALPIEIVPDLG
jgi:hypothetical protein